MNLLDLFVRVKVKDEASSGLSTVTDKIGDGLQKAARVGIAAVTAASAAVVKLTKDSIQAYGEYEQLVGGIDAVFSGNQQLIDKVVSTSRTAWKDLTMSSNAYYKSFTAAYPLIKSSIDDENTAIETTNRMLSLESDLANTFGYDMETAANAINWALKGTYSYIDNLNIGIGGTEEGFKEAAKAAGYVVDDVKSLTSEQILDVLEKSANQYGVLGRTASEASETIQGSANMVKASWENVLVALTGGTEEFQMNLETEIENLSTSVSTFIDNVAPKVEAAINGIGTMAEILIPTITTTIINSLPEILNAGVNIVSSLGRSILDNIDLLVDTVVQMVQTLSAFLSEHSVEVASAAVDIILALADGFIQSIPYIVNAIPQIIGAIWTALINHVPEIVEAGVQLMFGLVQGVMSYFAGVMSAADNIASAIRNVIRGVGGEAWNWGADLMANFINGINAWFNNLVAHLRNIAQTVRNFIGFSEPKMGPLSNFHTYAPDMMKLFAQGIEDNSRLVTDAFSNSFDLGMANVGQGSQYGSGLSGSSPSIPIILNITSEIDGEVLARNQYSYNVAEAERHGVAYA